LQQLLSELVCRERESFIPSPLEKTERKSPAGIHVFIISPVSLTGKEKPIPRKKTFRRFTLPPAHGIIAAYDWKLPPGAERS
jgi:hypothetical protein